MLAIQLLLLVLPIFVSSNYIGSFYNYLYEDKKMTLGELDQIQQQRVVKRMERVKKEFEKREEMKKKVDKMVLEDLKTLANDYKEYSAIGSNKKMTLGKYRAAIEDFNKKHPGRISLFENIRRDMKSKLAAKTL